MVPIEKRACNNSIIFNMICCAVIITGIIYNAYNYKEIMNKLAFVIITIALYILQIFLSLADSKGLRYLQNVKSMTEIVS